MEIPHCTVRTGLMGLALTALWACGYRQAARHTALEVTDSVHHFGTLQTNSGPATHRFLLVNHGEQNLVILKVTPSCSCMSAGYCRDVALQSDTLWVDVHFDTHNFLGDFDKTVQVKTTLGDIILHLDGDVE